MRNLTIGSVLLLLTALVAVEALQGPPALSSSARIASRAATPRIGHAETARGLKMGNGRPEPEKEEKRGFLGDLKGMLQNFDDVVDDFVYKRMGAGEQWYGKRKYDPSGRVDGDYNGMGRSDYFRIEIARVQKEEMEKRKQRRLDEEEEARRAKM